MRISYDAAKNERNLRERGLSFETVYEFDFSTALQTVDTRRDYGELRIKALGYLDQRLHALCYKETEDGIRVISFRKANRREQKKYDQAYRNYRR